MLLALKTQPDGEMSLDLSKKTDPKAGQSGEPTGGIAEPAHTGEQTQRPAWTAEQTEKGEAWSNGF